MSIMKILNSIMRVYKCCALLCSTIIIKEIKINSALWLFGECGRMYVCMDEVYGKSLSILQIYVPISFHYISPLRDRKRYKSQNLYSTRRMEGKAHIGALYIKYIFHPIFRSNYLIVSQFDWQFLSLLPFFLTFVSDAHTQSPPRSSSTSESVILNYSYINYSYIQFFVCIFYHIHINMIQVFPVKISTATYTFKFLLILTYICYKKN